MEDSSRLSKTTKKRETRVSGTSEQLGMRPRCYPTVRTAPDWHQGHIGLGMCGHGYHTPQGEGPCGGPTSHTQQNKSAVVVHQSCNANSSSSDGICTTGDRSDHRASSQSITNAMSSPSLVFTDSVLFPLLLLLLRLLLLLLLLRLLLLLLLLLLELDPIATLGVGLCVGIEGRSSLPPASESMALASSVYTVPFKATRHLRAGLVCRLQRSASDAAWLNLVSHAMGGLRLLLLMSTASFFLSLLEKKTRFGVHGTKSQR